MIRMVILLAVLVASVWIGLQLQQHPGYVLIAYGNWSLETTLLVAGISLLLLFLLFYILLRLLKAIFTITTSLHIWSQQRKMRKAKRETNEGLIELAEGNFPRAEKKLMHAIKLKDSALINYLGAARAAQEQGADERRDDYLMQAYKSNPKTRIAVELSQAQLQLGFQQYEQALATLRHLQELVPHHRYVLKLLKQTYMALNAWQDLVELLPALRKNQVLSDSELNSLERLVYENLFQQENFQGQKDLDKLWDSLPKKLRYDPVLARYYVCHLRNVKEIVKAEQILRDTLKRVWDKNLVILYGLIDANQQKQLVIAESWLKSHSKDAMLLLTLGRLAAKNNLWGKARSYLEASIGLKPSIEAYAALAQLLEKQNDSRLSKDYYQKAVLLSLAES